MRSAQKTMAIWAVVIIGVFVFFQMQESRSAMFVHDFNYAKFLDAVEKGEVKKDSVVFNVASNEIEGKLTEAGEKNLGGSRFKITGNTNDKGFELLREKGITPSYVNADNSMMASIFLNWLPLIIIVAMFFFFMRQVQVGGGKAMQFGKSRARLLTENKNRVTFKDVAGVEEAKQDLREIVEFLKDPKKFTRLGGRIPKGVLLVGPPGTGKTLLARSVAGEANVPFFTISGSDFVEMFVGVGASRVRDLFEQGKRQAPCIIFIDEIDAVGRHRGAGMGGGHDEREQTLNQLLVEMDGFESNEGVILIAATNRPDVLDPALLRPGRFDRRVVVSKPDLKGREQILKVHTRKVPLASDVNLETIGRGTPGFSGADLENLVNESALQAARENKDRVDMEDFEKAKDKVIMGSERKSMVISEEDKKLTAYHEAGHAIVGHVLPNLDPIHKVTIIPRGMALGLTQMLPKEDQLNLSRSKATNMIAYMFGGRAAEELIFKDYTTGAGNDIERATDLARRMVCEWGMSDKLGPMSYTKSEGPVFLGMQNSQQREYSDSKAQEIDAEVFRLITEAHDTAMRLLKENESALHTMAQSLLEFETIDTDEVTRLVKGATLQEIRALREQRKEQKEKDDSDPTKKKMVISPGDPVGNRGPVTA